MGCSNGMRRVSLARGQVRTGQDTMGQDRTGQVRTGKVSMGQVRTGQVLTEVCLEGIWVMLSVCLHYIQRMSGWYVEGEPGQVKSSMASGQVKRYCLKGKSGLRRSLRKTKL